MNEFGQKGKVPLSERLSVSPEEASALTGIGLTSIREAISSGDLKAKKHGRRTIILPDDLRVWLKRCRTRASRLKKAPLRRGFYFSAVLRSRLTVGRSGKWLAI
jgi:excisionase family DNA binding protein